MKSWIKKQFRKNSRVYIMPTRMGGYILGLLFLMFLLSIGYSNNLMLIFTLIFFAFNLMWLVEGHFYLNALKFKSLEIKNGHSGELTPLRIFWLSSPESPWRWKFTLESEKHSLSTNQVDFDEGETLALIQSPSRGPCEIKYIKAETDRPHGLYKTWRYFKTETSFLSYPALIKVSKADVSGFCGEGEELSDKKGQDDFKSFSPYQGNEAKKISWKHYARSGELIVKEGEANSFAIARFELHLPSNPELKEIYLSQLASEMVSCHRKLIPFSFKAGNIFRHPSGDLQHLNECLSLLAIC